MTLIFFRNFQIYCKGLIIYYKDLNNWYFSFQFEFSKKITLGKRKLIKNFSRDLYTFYF